MKSTKLLRVAAMTVLGLSLGATVASAAPGTGTIGTTGPNSHNEVTFNDGNSVSVDNNNSVRVSNYTDQHAYTGDAVTANNTTAGGAASGDAVNDSSLSAHLSVSNTSSSAAALAAVDNGSSSGTITNTGPSSFNEVTFNGGSEVSVDNNNCISIQNNVDQRASSGDATVTNNTTGGSATTGDAMNTSSTDLTVSISN
jgi:hypothetical protein